MTQQPRPSTSRAIVIGAIIGGIATVSAAFISLWQPWQKQLLKTDVVVRVADTSGTSVSGASVLLMREDKPPENDYSDSNGVANFTIGFEGKELDVRLIIETNQYQIFERNIRLPLDQAINVRLLEPDPEAGKVIVRVVNDKTNKTVTGAEVILISDGDIYRQATDSYGLTKFPLTFPDGKIDARISVETTTYETNDQRVTLLPDRVQDVRLDPETQTIKIVPVSPELTIQEITPSNEDFTPLEFTLASSRDQSLLAESDVGLYSKVLISKIDLNGDNKDEIVASQESDGSCGNRGCPIYIIQETSLGEWKTIFSLLGGPFLNVGASVVNGYYEISRPAGIGNIELVWTFNGIEYEQSHFLDGSYKIRRLLPERTATALQTTPFFLQPSLNAPSSEQVQLG